MTFTITNLEKLKEFREKHKECEFTSTIGGKFSFIFTPTGLGIISQIKCNACQEIEDLTEDIW